MTKSTITREESVQAVFDLKVGYRLGFADIETLKRVARMALAAMGSEPVAYMHDGEDGTEYNGHNEFSGGGKGIPLYRHAQQPVVGYVPLGDSPYDIPYSMPSNLREFIDQEIGILFSDDDAQGVWIACRRAAMLNGGKS